MRKIMVIFLAATAMSLSSCNDKETKESTSNNPKAQVVQHKNHHNIELNNGQKWKANIETTEGIIKMTALVNAKIGSKQIKDYHALQSQLINEFQIIFKKCTMKGEAHNQLHNFLFPMKEIFDDLGSENIKTAQNATYQLKQHLNIYSNYFE